MDGAIEHICFLADVNRLYENALGLYDLELALLVAQQSQKVGWTILILSIFFNNGLGP